MTCAPFVRGDKASNKTVGEYSDGDDGCIACSGGALHCVPLMWYDDVLCANTSGACFGAAACGAVDAASWCSCAFSLVI